MNPIAEDILMHYGIPRRSGRYPWGSGDDAYQHTRDFLGRIETLKKQGWSETPENIKKEFGLSTTEYRSQKAIANNERRMLEVARAKSLKEDGLGYTEIGRKMGLNESTVRSLLNERSEAKMNQAKKTANFLKEQIKEKEGQKKQRKTTLIGGLCCGVAICTASTFQQIGMLYTSVGKAGFITALYIVLVPIFGLFLKRKTL